MPHHKKHRMERIKEAIHKTPLLSEKEKSEGLKKVEAWYTEDKAFGLLYDELAAIADKYKPMLKELGFD